MPPKLALLLCIGYILWLLAFDRRRHPTVSNAIWIPLAWAIILGSRPTSIWFGGGAEFTGSDDSLEGSPVDRLFFLVLIIAGLIILVRRRVNLGAFIHNNKWVFLLFLYFAISVLWSDYPFVSFKRWIKDLGNVILVLVVLTESQPVDAVKALLARCCYVLIPVNVLLVKYFPEAGRYYNRWTYESYFSGATLDKNMLGMTLFVFGVSQFWILGGLRPTAQGAAGKLQLAGHYIMPVFTFWLLFKSQSSTAIGCTLLAWALFFVLRFQAIKSRVSRLVFFGVASVVVLFVLQVTINFGGFLLGLLGRDLTFTGRTEIWSAVLAEDINPLFGTGYYSFWLGERAEHLSQKYFYQLNEAHNGYIELYLNNGLIGVVLLAALYFSAGRRICYETTIGSRFGAQRLAFIVAVSVYGVTEAVFRFGLIWFVFLLFVIEHISNDQQMPASVEAENLVVE